MGEIGLTCNGAKGCEFRTGESDKIRFTRLRIRDGLNDRFVGGRRDSGFVSELCQFLPLHHDVIARVISLWNVLCLGTFRQVCYYMLMRSFVWIGAAVGSTIGSLIPGLWGASVFSLSSILLSGVGAILGIWIGFELGR